MIKLTRKFEYALIAIKFINDQGSDSAVSAKMVSDRCSIPYHLLTKILQKLVRIGILKADRGKSGGYSIHIHLREINMADFIERFEGPIAISDCVSNNECMILDKCSIRLPINRINTNLRGMFSKINLNDLTA